MKCLSFEPNANSLSEFNFNMFQDYINSEHIRFKKRLYARKVNRFMTNLDSQIEDLTALTMMIAIEDKIMNMNESKN